MDNFLFYPLAIGSLSTTEIVLIFLVILLLFGARKLPELAKGLGQAMREFKKATREAEDNIRSAIDEPVKPATPPPAKPEAQKPEKPSDAQ